LSPCCGCPPWCAYQHGLRQIERHGGGKPGEKSGPVHVPVVAGRCIYVALWCSDERVVVEVHDQGRKARVEEVPFVEVMVAYVDEDRHGEPPTDSRSLPWWQVVGSLVVDEEGGA
jgi:hypothetical protein